jgi:Divergent InlB B-repeat domain
MLRAIAICVLVIVLAALRLDAASAQTTSSIEVMLGGYGEVVTDGYSCTVADFESGACPPLPPAPIGSTLTFTANPVPITEPGTGNPVPVPSSTFVGWSRPECQGTGPCTMTVADDEEEIVAHFSPVWLEIIDPENAATSVVVSGPEPTYCTPPDSPPNCMTALYENGTRLDVTATPPNALAFGCDPFDSDLVAGRCAIETSNIRNFVILAPAGTEPAEPPFNLRKPVTVKRAGSGGGRVQGAGTDASGTNWSIDCGTDCRLKDIQYQTRIRLRAIEASGSTFERWAGPPCGGQTVCTFTAGKYPTVRATFSSNASASASSSSTSSSSSNPGPGPGSDPGPRPGSAPFSVSVSRATASGRRAKRRIVVTLTTNRSARATLRLTRKGRRVTSRTFALPTGTSTLMAKVRRGTRAGWYRMSLNVTAADGTRKSFSKRLHLRR